MGERMEAALQENIAEVIEDKRHGWRGADYAGSRASRSSYAAAMVGRPTGGGRSSRSGRTNFDDDVATAAFVRELEFAAMVGRIKR
jgi:hypothetical protein